MVQDVYTIFYNFSTFPIRPWYQQYYIKISRYTDTVTPLTSISRSPPYPHLLTNTHHSSFYKITNPLYHALTHTSLNSSNPVTESQNLIYYLRLEISLQIIKLFKSLGWLVTWGMQLYLLYIYAAITSSLFFFQKKGQREFGWRK